MRCGPTILLQADPFVQRRPIWVRSGQLPLNLPPKSIRQPLIVGFVGVLIITHPGAGTLTYGALFALGNAFLISTVAIASAA